MNSRIVLIGMIGIALMLLGTVSAGATGIENITLSSYSANVMPGNSIKLNYTLTLSSGHYASGTVMSIDSSNVLTTNNISPLLSTGSVGNPTLRGVVYIFTLYNTSPGTYNIIVNGSSTNVKINTATFVLNVVGNKTKSNTTTATTTANSTVSTATTTAQQTTSALSTAPATVIPVTTPSSGGLGNGSIYVIIVIIIVAAMAIWFISMRGKSGKRGQQHAEHKAMEPKNEMKE